MLTTVFGIDVQTVAIVGALLTIVASAIGVIFFLAKISNKLDKLDEVGKLHAQINTITSTIDAQKAAHVPDNIENMSEDLQDVSEQTEDIDESVDSLADSLGEIDFHGIERFIMGLGWDDVRTGSNSVQYELPESGLSVTISLSDDSPDPRVIATLQKFSDEYDDPDDPTDVSMDPDDVTVVLLDFADQFNTKSVVNKINDDSEVASVEKELFGQEGYFATLSPYEVTYAQHTDDYEKVAEFLNQFTEYIDKYVVQTRAETDKFDAVVEEELK